MLEEQVAVARAAPWLWAGRQGRLAQGARRVSAVAKREEKITDVAQELINIVEETEFGIALPAALAAVRDATETVKGRLADGDARTTSCGPKSKSKKT